MDHPLITTIIPTFRRPQLLRRALLSAVKQTYPLIQICVYDNASGDETQEVAEEFISKDARVKYHCHAQNLGMLGNYEYALKHVETPYFSLLSDDDVIFPWFYETALKELKQHPQASFAACSTLIMNDLGNIVRVPLDLWPREGCFNPPDGAKEMISKYPIPTTVLFRKKVIQAFPIDKANPLTWDCDFLTQIAAHDPVLISKRPCGIFLQHGSSYSNAQDFKQWKEALNRLSQRIHLTSALSLEDQTFIAELIQRDLKGTLRAFIQKSLFDRKFTLACDYAAQFYKDYGYSFTAFVLLSLSWLCRLFPLTIYPLFFLRKLKRTKEKNAYSSQDFAKWLTSNED